MQKSHGWDGLSVVCLCAYSYASTTQTTPNPPLSRALCAWSNMQKENGDTEIAFLAALFYWVVTIATGWMSKSVFEAWQNGTAFELVSRKARFLNFFPTWFVFIVSVVAVAFMAFVAIKQTLKFVRYLRS